MLQKELIKLGIFAGIGFAIGIILANLSGTWAFALLMPIYSIGFCYGAVTFVPWLLKASAGMGKMGCLAAVMGSWVMAILIFIAFIFVIFLTFLVGWLVGLVIAIMRFASIIREGETISSFAPVRFGEKPFSFGNEKGIPDEKPFQLGDEGGFSNQGHDPFDIPNDPFSSDSGHTYDTFDSANDPFSQVEVSSEYGFGDHDVFDNDPFEF